MSLLQDESSHTYTREEHKKKSLIIDCYLVMRGSLPSDEEVDFWFNQTEDEIKQGILYSDEFNGRYGV